MTELAKSLEISFLLIINSKYPKKGTTYWLNKYFRNREFLPVDERDRLDKFSNILIEKMRNCDFCVTIGDLEIGIEKMELSA